MRIVAAGLVGLVLLGPAGAAAQEPDRPQFLLDTPSAPAGYGRLLSEYVEVVDLPGGGIETRFDYAAFHAAEDQTEIRERLRKRFLSITSEGMDRASFQAWALNAYNFLVIDVVIENFVTADGDTLESIAEIGEGDFAVFEEKRYEVEGKTYSLNSFEQYFLFSDEHKGLAKDPRFHFALVCAAVGCPALWPEPYMPEDLSAQLDRATANTLGNPRHLRYEDEVLHLSKIFDWYEDDFEGRGGVKGFLEQHLPAGVAEQVPDIDPVRVEADIEWDWSLNRVE